MLQARQFSLDLCEVNVPFLTKSFFARQVRFDSDFSLLEFYSL